MKKLQLFTIFLIIYHVWSSPTMCHCPNGQIGMQCPMPIQLNCPPQAPCPSSPPCNVFGNFPTLPTLPPHNFQTLAPFTLSPLSGGQAAYTTPLPLAVSPPANGQETLLGINQPASPLQYQQPQQSYYQGQQVPAASQNAEAPPALQQYPVERYPQQQYQEASQPANYYKDGSTTEKPATLPSETYVQLENPDEIPTNYSPPPPVLQNNVEHVYESEPNNGYRQPVRRQAPKLNLNEKCNDDRLRKIIEENVDDNPSSSKRKIQKAASDEIGGLFDVICSAHDFSYLANTQLFCEAGNDDVTCFAFLHSLIQ